MVRKNLLFVLFVSIFVSGVLAPVCLHAQAPVASFTVPGNNGVYWSENFDGTVTGWTYKTTNKEGYNWKVKNDLTGTKSFKTIYPGDKASLYIEGLGAPRWGAQNEWAISPKIDIPENASLSFYAGYTLNYISSGWNMKLMVSENAGTDWVEKWSAATQSSGENPYAWRIIDVNLKDFAGKQIQMAWVCTASTYGADFILDSIAINTPQAKENISIHTGDSVPFYDKSSGNPTSWLWEFEGGTPATSTEKNPVVHYYKSGSYSVKLTATNSSGANSKTINQMVVVEDLNPVAKIGSPLSFRAKNSNRAFFVPVKEPIEFSDNSTNYPNSWNWYFDGGTLIEGQTEAKAKVSFPNPGFYGASLSVQNSKGNSSDITIIEAGTKSFVWNFQPGDGNMTFFKMDENQYFPGNNTKIEAYAEYFGKPAVPVLLDSVEVCFVGNQTADEDFYNKIQTITVSVCKAENGVPGEVLTSGSWTVVDIHTDKNNPCGFPLDKNLIIDFPFFIVVKGIPMYADPGLNMTIGMAPWRSSGNTAYLKKKNEDWRTADSYFGKDKHTSLYITPRLNYSILVPEKDKVDFSTEVETKAVTVYASYLWGASSDQSWCKITNMNNGVSPGSISLSCEKHTGLQSRTAWITLTNDIVEKKIQVVQAGTSTSIVAPEAGEFASAFIDRSGVLHVQYDNGASSVAVYGVDGKKYEEKILSPEKDSDVINVSYLSKGVYVVVLSNGSNNRTIKLVKQ